MKIDLFIEQLEEEFDELEPGTLKAETNFKDLDDWSSMYALIIIALIDMEYDVTITGEELKTVETVQQLFDLMKSKK